MPRTFYGPNLLANMVAKLGNIVGEHVKFDMLANNVFQFGPTFKKIVRKSQGSTYNRYYFIIAFKMLKIKFEFWYTR